MMKEADLERARRRIEALGPPWQLQEPSGKARCFYIHEPDDWNDTCGPHSIRCRSLEVVHNELDEIEKVARNQSVGASSIVAGAETIEEGHYWIALNGSSCAMASFPMEKPLVSPVPQQLFGFPTYEEAREAQKLCLTAPIKSVNEYIQSLGPHVKAGRVKYIRPTNPEPQTGGPTMWVDDGGVP